MVISQLLVTFGSRVTVKVAELDSIDQLCLTLLGKLTVRFPTVM
jgi:hypothetical protein